MERVDVEWMISGASADVTMKADGGREGTGKQKAMQDAKGRRATAKRSRKHPHAFPIPNPLQTRRVATPHKMLEHGPPPSCLIDCHYRTFPLYSYTLLVLSKTSKSRG